MRQLHDDLWVHEDSMKLGAVDLPLRMTIVRLTGGGLWVHSPTTITDALKAELDALGPVTALVEASNGHNLWLSEWRQAYPDAIAYVSRGIPKKLPALTNYQFLDEHAQAAWPEDLQALAMAGVPFFDETVFLHGASASLILTDFVQNHADQERTGFARVMTKLVLEPIGFKGICVAPPLRLKFMIKDRSAFTAFVDAIQQWSFERIIVTHGNVIDTDAKATLARLCQRFAG